MASKKRKEYSLTMSNKNVIKENVSRYNSNIKDKEPSDELKIALKQSEDIISGKISAKRYKDINELFEDLNNDIKKI